MQNRRDYLLALIRDRRDEMPTWQVGFLIHAYGDAWSHLTTDNGSVAYSATNGHFQDSLSNSTHPDLIANRPNSYREYVRNLYAALGGQGRADDHPVLQRLLGQVQDIPQDAEREAIYLRDFVRDRYGEDFRSRGLPWAPGDHNVYDRMPSVTHAQTQSFLTHVERYFAEKARDPNVAFQPQAK